MLEELHVRWGRGECLLGMREELYPGLRPGLKINGREHITTEDVAIIVHRDDGLLKELHDQIVFILIVAIEGGSADHRTVCNLPDGDGIETALFDQGNERVPDELLSAPDAQIALDL